MPLSEYFISMKWDSDSKNLPVMRETQVQSLGWENPPKKGMATHSSIFVWRTSRTEEPGRLQSTGCKESDTTELLTLLLSIRFKFIEHHFYKGLSWWKPWPKDGGFIARTHFCGYAHVFHNIALMLLSPLA